MVEAHFNHTQSPVANRVLAQWETLLPKFVKIMPVDYKRALEKLEKE
jgi:glutamate synthase (ferredoxin)